MHEQHLFEYAVLRVVPRVEREEFLNVGVVLYCRQQKFLQTKYHLDRARIQAVFPGVDLQEVEMHLRAFEQISQGDAAAGPIACLDAASRFRWLTAKRSTVVQTSGVHPGLCKDAAATLQRLHAQLVEM